VQEDSDHQLTSCLSARFHACGHQTVQENAGYAINMVVTGSLEPHQAVMHHRMANEVVVSDTFNSEMRDKNVKL